MPLESVKSLESKYELSFAIDTSSRLWSWGANFYGQLGRPSNESYDSTPRIIDSLKKYKIKQVACGSFHVCCLTVDGEVFTWSNVYDRIQTRSNASLKDIKPPKKLDIEKIWQIACGERHTLLLSVNQRTVWAFGCNDYGHLGHDIRSLPSDRYFSTPMKVPFIGDKKIIKLQCGSRSSAVLCADGEITVWGHTTQWYDYGNGHLPRVINIEQKVADISMSEEDFFLLALTVDNRLYAVGNNRSGQCGQGHDGEDYDSDDSRNFYEQPVQVKKLQNLRIKQMSAGYWHCLIVCTKI